MPYSAPPAELVRETFARLDAIDEPVLRAVVELHARQVDGLSGWRCTGCDIEGYEAEEPAWPCRTVELIIERHLGVTLPDKVEWGLVQRPSDGSLDFPVSPVVLGQVVRNTLG